MWPFLTRRRWRRSIALATAIYVVVLLASAFEHHDLLCHLRNPQHCTACSSAQLGSDPQTLIAPRTFDLADAGRATALHVIADGTLLGVRSTGRSPPRHA
jgi:hypothetical protein